MLDLVEAARRSAEITRAEILKVMQHYQHGQAEYDMIDDAYLGIGWTIRRLAELEKSLSAPQQPSP